MKNAKAFTVYGMTLSGNCHKVKTILDLTKQPYSWVETDTRNKATQTQEFKAMSHKAQVPLLALPDGSYISESNAILYYLAQNSPYWPGKPIQQTQALGWMFFEQNMHEPNIAVNRARLAVFKVSKVTDADMVDRHQKGVRALDVLEKHLQAQNFLVENIITIADISLYAYTHVAHEGGFDLTPFKAIQSWLKRLEEHGISPIPAAS